MNSNNPTTIKRGLVWAIVSFIVLIIFGFLAFLKGIYLSIMGLFITFESFGQIVFETVDTVSTLAGQKTDLVNLSNLEKNMSYFKTALIYFCIFSSITLFGFYGFLYGIIQMIFRKRSYSFKKLRIIALLLTIGICLLLILLINLF